MRGRIRGRAGVAICAGLVLGATVLALGAGIDRSATAAAKGGKGFVRKPIPLQSGRAFDLGVSDLDRDGRFEVFTANHKYLGSVLERSRGAWRERLAQLGLSSTPDYPGFEDLLHPPRAQTAGLYIYAASRTADIDGHVHKDSRLNLIAKDVSGIPLLDQPARGRIILLSPRVKVVRKRGAKVTITRDRSVVPARTTVEFEVAENAHLELLVRKIDLPPIEVRLDQAAVVARTFVGARKVRAQSSRFRLYLQDRHGLAWGDFNSDGRTDVLIARGGLAGQISDFRGAINDELFRHRADGRFENVTDSAGLWKGACRARRASTGDYLGGTALDLFTSCKGAPPRLWRGKGNGRFVSASAQMRRAGVRGTLYRWVDIRGGPRPELLVGSKRRLEVFALRKGRFRQAQSVRALNRASKVDSLTYGDVDGDGDADVFVAAPSGNTFFRNRNGRLHRVSPRRLGLPGRSFTASLVDVNLDGSPDLHTFPGGLYVAKRRGGFRRTGLARSTRKANFALGSWFDFDSDGDLDLVQAVKRKDGVDVQTALIKNRRARGRWLQFNLIGKPGNSEAIGARVTLRAAGRRQTGWVGQIDSSRYSQGHYRLYFGLRKSHGARRVIVHWPDGRRSRLGRVRGNRVVTVRHPRAH